MYFKLHVSAGSGISYDVYGVFDGHGGKQAATFASKHVLPVLQEELVAVQLKPASQLPEELESFSQISDQDRLVWQTQDALLSELPAALVNTFRKVQDQFHERTQVQSPELNGHSLHQYHCSTHAILPVGSLHSI